MSLWLFPLLFSLPLLEAGPVAHTQYGAVEGKTLKLNTGEVVNRWHSIPFARPPVGALRWKPPVDPEPWTGVRAAHRLPNACPQSWGLIQLTHQTWTRYSEDCLYLNIYAPNDTSGAPYPVMVYIHGGAYSSSANIQYPGHFMAAKGVVVAVVNYRLGALGFMSTGDDVAPGNYGLMDQIKALTFVRDNIGQFGGDPDRVTLFGQSAGAASTGLLSLSPKTEGLFHQILTQSGSDQAVWSVNHPDSSPHLYTRQVARKVNCSHNDSAAMMDCMRKVEAKDLRKSVKCTPGYFCLGFAPVVDGPDGLLPSDPWTLRERGKFKKLPLLSGITKDDGSLYTVSMIPESLYGGFNRSEFLYHLEKDLINVFEAQFNGTKEDVMQAVSFFYSPWPNIEDREANRDMFNVLITDFGMGGTADIQLRSQSQYVNATYAYILGYGSKKAWMIPKWIGVPHIADLPYVWGYPLLKDNFNVRYDSGMLIDIISWDDEDRQWADYIITLWTNFAKYGNPTAVPVKQPGSETLTDWPPFSMDGLNHLRLERDIRTEQGYRQLNFAFWRDYFFKVSKTSWLKEKDKETLDVPNHLTPTLQERFDNLFRSLAQQAITLNKEL